MIFSSKLLLMGDASVRSEQDIISSYNLPKIDILKVGHHGSNISSSKKFINEINPKYSLISVGENNRYGHLWMEIQKQSLIIKNIILGLIVHRKDRYELL